MGASNWGHRAFEIAKRLKHAELLVELARLKGENADKTTRIIDLEKRVLELEDQIAASSELTLVDGVYWHGGRRPLDPGSTPLCPACYDAKRKKIHMQVNRDEYVDDFFSCPACELRIRDPIGKKAEPITAGRFTYR